jgi:hypothetical protein
MKKKYKFSPANSKLIELERETGLKVYSFSILSGHSCPYANECHSKAVKIGGRTKVTDGPQTRFRCFSASQEAQYPNVYNSRKFNFDLIKQDMKYDRVVKRLLFSLPDDAGIIRVHAAGDFYSQKYFDCWLEVTKQSPQTIFYAYTKSIPFWLKRKDEIPDNFVLTASIGGKKDKLVYENGLRYAKVVFSFDEAQSLGLPVDFDDVIAALPKDKNKNFALLLHGPQISNSNASKALSKLRENGWTGYNKVK